MIEPEPGTPVIRRGEPASQPVISLLICNRISRVDIMVTSTVSTPAGITMAKIYVRWFWRHRKTIFIVDYQLKPSQKDFWKHIVAVESGAAAFLPVHLSVFPVIRRGLRNNTQESFGCVDFHLNTQLRLNNLGRFLSAGFPCKQYMVIHTHTHTLHFSCAWTVPNS